MPTGYTAPIADGITFEQYALGCARAFGALVTMRDEPASAPIPDRIEPSDYYQKSLEEKHKTLERVSAWTPAQIELEYRIDFEKRVLAHADRMQKAADLRAKYTAMLLTVRAWTPPTPDHVEYKAFMEQQILQSIDFDCSTAHDVAPEPQESSQWLADWIVDLKDSVAHYEQEHRKEVERAHSRTQWIKALRDSLA
ncbi:hypothetical protein P3T40_003451 [Paraburkholderia sp. EB58]|uniref:hypothetical protein n=1 Tax=Paraburkholderia sp. EB58 TaxID=3035125 RepID=UPI003D1CC768